MTSGDAEHWDHLCLPRDSVDALVDSWARLRPDLDVRPVGIVSRLGRVRGHVDAALDEVFAAHGLTAANFAVLVTLARIGDERGVSQRRLADELGLTSGTMSVRMDRLVAEGLVARGVDPELKRNTLITLTPRGRGLFDRVVPAHLGNERRLLAALSPDEQAALTSLLRKLLVEYEGSRPPAGAPFGLGLTVAPVHVALALREAVGLAPVVGLLVRGVEDEGPAARAGLRTGDVLVRAAKRDLRSVAALYAAIADAAEARKLRLELVRGTEEHRVTVALAEAHALVGARAATAGRSAAGEHVL